MLEIKNTLEIITELPELANRFLCFALPEELVTGLGNHPEIILTHYKTLFKYLMPDKTYSSDKESLLTSMYDHEEAKSLTEDLAYALYKIEWLQRHVSEEDFTSTKADYIQTKEYYTSFEEYVEEIGFGGCIYACQDEFLDSEFEIYKDNGFDFDIKLNSSAKKSFLIPVEWSVYSTIRIQADSLEEAFKIAERHIDELPCPSEHEYIDGSYKINGDTIEDMTSIQDYADISNYEYKEENGELKEN